MDSRTLFFLTGLILVAITLLFSVNYAPSLQKPFFGEAIAKSSVSEAFISKGDKKVLLSKTTLNILIDTINSSQAIVKDTLPKNLESAKFDKIEINFKDSAPYVLKPVGYKENTLYYILLDPETKEPKLLKESPAGKLRDSLPIPS